MGGSKASTEGGKSDRLPRENEKAGTAKQESAKVRPRKPGVAERLTRDELGRVARADSKAGYAEYDCEGRYRRETEALARLKGEHPSLAIEPNPAREIGGGAEHLVEQDTNPARVF
jgi:hypothetical protein